MPDTTYEEDVLIDENDLEKEWSRQPALMMKWSLKYALAVKRKARAEQNLKVVRAEVRRKIDKYRATIDQDIRLYPADYGFDDQPTEQAIINAINRDKEFEEFVVKQEAKIQQANDQLLEAIEEEEVYGAAKTAMVHRRKSLENLAAFYHENYNSEPRLPRQAQKARYQNAQEIDREIRESRSKRRE